MASDPPGLPLLPPSKLTPSAIGPLLPAGNDPYMSLLATIWSTLALMAPWLVLGFLIAGGLAVLLPTSFVARHLAGRGPWAVVKAAALGIPLPVCSCGVVPLAAALRQRGASPAATLSFLIATPATSVDAVFACAMLIGGAFALASPLAALVAALLGGLLLSFQPDRGQPATSYSSGPALAEDSPHGWRGMLRHGFVVIPAQIGREVLLGILLAGLITALVPPDLFASHLGQGLTAKLAMVACAVPIYVCSSASVPMAAGLIAAGASPGTALAFLMAGPAVNAASALAVGRLLGRRALMAYLLAIIAVALLAGTVFDALPITVRPLAASSCRDCHHLAWWQHLAAITLLGLVAVPPLTRRLRPPPTGGPDGHCHHCRR